jgi:ABC-type nitrate/sulfonate/bicarbonate transport system permease component
VSGATQAGAEAVLAEVPAPAPARRSSRLEDAARERRRKWVYRTIVWGGLLVVWELVAIRVGPNFLPTLQAIVIEGVGGFIDNGFITPFLNSWLQLAIGFGVALAITIPLGVLLGWSRVARTGLMPYMNGLFVTPTAALLPLVIIFAGSDLLFRVTVVVLFAFYYPLINTAAGVRQTDGGLRDLARTLCMSRLAVFRKIVVPGAMPYIVVGIRLGLAAAIQGMVIAELWVLSGIGEVLKNLAQFRRLPEFFAIVIMIVAVALLATGLIRLFEVKVLARRGMVARVE